MTLIGPKSAVNSRVPLRSAAAIERLRPWLCWIALLAVFAVGLSPRRLFAQTLQPNEYQVEAAYLYNFGKFVSWPSAYTSKFRGRFAICVFNHDPLAPVLQSMLAGKQLRSTPVAIQRIDQPQQAVGCRVLFIGSAKKRQLNIILAALGSASVLTVSDIAGFSKHGGMIQFLMVGDHVRFVINRTMAQKAGLVLDSDLLKVAVAVLQTGRTGGP